MISSLHALCSLPFLEEDFHLQMIEDRFAEGIDAAEQLTKSASVGIRERRHAA